MNATLGAPAPDDGRTHPDEPAEQQWPGQDRQLGWPLGALCLVAAVAGITVVATASAVTTVVMTAVSAVVVLVADHFTD